MSVKQINAFSPNFFFVVCLRRQIVSYLTLYLHITPQKYELIFDGQPVNTLSPHISWCMENLISKPFLEKPSK